MEPISGFDSNSDFIELHRTFRELSKNGSDNDDLDIIHALGIGERLLWPDLIKEYRLVILSEAGSGKTYEIRNIAHKLKERGKPAFFLRLEHIPWDFKNAFEVGTYEAFTEWLDSSEEGWILLDSVDEARLRDPRDFERAIRKLGRGIIAAKDRTHIVITGRTTAWRSKTDLAHCEKHLPYAGAITSESDTKNHDDAFEGSLQTETKAKDEFKSVFKIVAFDDLTSDQIAVFVKARGIKDSQAFLDAVERADARSFASRPQDLEELTEFWIDQGRIGTRLELMRNSIDRRLAERDQNRDDAGPLSAERARSGARLLAAATTLMQNQTIRVPDGTDNSKGIAVQSVLPDWDSKDQSVLLSRPIFDEAIYGAVRFHHRSVREYLTAEWFSELLKRGTSRRTIERLFFRNQYGVDIVVPTLRPILPWLAILDEKIRDRVCKEAPEIIFEGGDPSRLPIEIRRHILHEVCDQMARNVTGRSMHDYAAVQRFANSDLIDDIRTLIHKYADNEDLTAFLLRMVWIGQLANALPEAMDVALNPKAERYLRAAAFRAVKAIGSLEDQDRVRQSFLAEASGLRRDWLAELLDGLEPTEKNLVWLLSCLEKSQPKEPYTSDRLKTVLTEFVNAADIELLPMFIAGVNRLLNFPPMIERRYCKVSQKFKWLMVPVSKAVERLISARHPASRQEDTLSVLHKISAVLGYDSHELSESKTEFKKMIPAWKELNRALFWFEVQQTREAIYKKNKERLINYWRVSIAEPLWLFEESDFVYVVEEIARKKFLDNKLVALSLAFSLYRSANRPHAWLSRLKTLAARSDDLSDRLNTYLRPPPQSKDERRWKRQELKWKRQAAAREKRQKQYHKKWRRYLNENFKEIRASQSENPGTITGPLDYLFQQTRNENHGLSRWTEYNWKMLIPEYGEDVARFYRDASVSFWRHHNPKLRSEGAPLNKTTYAVIVGLTGIEIEANETTDWPEKLSVAEAERACKYASFELNGFPTWFSKLFMTFPQIVSSFLIREVRYELSIEKPETDSNYIISDLSWYGHWAWDQLAPIIYDLLKKEPKNLSNLDNLLKVLQGSNLSDGLIQKLASRKCRTLRNSEHAARWFAVWIGVAPGVAIDAIHSRIEQIADHNDRTFFMMIFVTHLCGDRSGGTNVRQEFKKPEYLKALYILMHEHIRKKEDINRVGTGAYSPGLRDHAQDGRDSLLGILNQIPGKDSFLALNDIARMHPDEAHRPWISLHAKTKAEQDGDIGAWSSSQIREFQVDLEYTPISHDELAELAILRLLDLKDDLENGDSSVADILKKITQETEIRNYIARELREKAFGRYSIPQEEELADAKRPDLRFHGVGFDGPVPTELKLADNWSGPKLFERLENQLCGDYLRDRRSGRGIFLLVYRGEKPAWDVPYSENRVSFSGLTAALQNHWQRISSKFPGIDDVTVIGIDLPKRSA